MTDATHCDRCDARGSHKGDKDRTPAFPGEARLTAFTFTDRTNEYYELCQDCTEELAAFLGDDATVDRLRDAHTDEEKRHDE